MILIELILKLFFSSVIYPIALEIAHKREIDPVFKAESDKLYGDLRDAQTTADRKAAARKLYELQKNS